MADGKLIGIFQKERPLLRKKNTESVQVNLKLICFNLRKVGIVSDVHGQAGRQRVFYVETKFVICVARLATTLYAFPKCVGRYFQIFLRRNFYTANRASV